MTIGAAGEVSPLDSVSWPLVAGECMLGDCEEGMVHLSGVT
jgi:hypothetical protein